MVQVPIGLRLDAELLARIDAARGDVPRARWIARACERYLPNFADLPAPVEQPAEPVEDAGDYPNNEGVDDWPDAIASWQPVVFCEIDVIAVDRVPVRTDSPVENILRPSISRARQLDNLSILL